MVTAAGSFKGPAVLLAGNGTDNKITLPGDTGY
jgi:hypothetical protein